MTLTLKDMQTNVNERVTQHPDWYFPDKKIFEKMVEEQKEIEEALVAYKQLNTEENLKKLELEFGDELFAIICLANKLDIDLEKCFTLMMEKNKDRAKNNYQK